uniref:Uncharacterized mitochondrial protein AtMg00810-like n=1 Tax=Tanacetum cinerariifolium TaxID=118510 RepID=A0A6L2J1B4_TANCI|nr:uncharacterized mitochondrial protein AtMg00810-like [Tanacetum cinerariifolium]
MEQPNPTFVKILILDTGKFKQWKFRIQQYLQNEHYALWEVIEFGDSCKAPLEESSTGSASESSAKKKGRSVAITTEDMQKRINDGAILKTFGGNEATQKTKENQLKQQYGNFKAEGLKTLEQTFNRLQAIVSHLEFIDVKIEQDDLNQKFLTSLALEWLMYTIVWRNRNDLDTLTNTSSGKGEINTASVPTATTQVSPASANVVAASISHDTVCAYIASQSNGSQIKYEDITQIDEDDIKEIDIKAPRSQDMDRRENYKQGSKKEEPTPKALMAIDGIGWDWSYMANEEENHALVADDEALIEFSLMAKSSSSSKNEDTVLFPPPAQVYSPSKKDMSWTGLPEFADDTITDYSRPFPSIKSNTSDLQNSNSSISEHKESSESIMSKPVIKFVKAGASPKIIKTNKVETTRKPSDSGCSRHMTGNISYLSDYEPYDGGYVSFGQGGGKITSKARTMLADAKLPVTFWAKACNTACYAQNRDFYAKRDEGYFVGYSMSSKAFKVFNKRTKKVEENMHVDLLENKLIEKGAGLNWLFDIDTLTNSMNYVLVVVVGTSSTNISGTKDAASQGVKKDVSSLRYIALPNWFHEAHLESSNSNAQNACNVDAPESSGISNPTATSKNPSADQMETLTVESAIPTISLPVPTVCLDNSPETLSDTRLILKGVTSQDEAPSLDNILTLSNRFEDILEDTTNTIDTNGVEANVSNMESILSASPTPSFRIHKDHPKSQIIGPVDTPVQTRHKSKEMVEHSFIATIHQKTTHDLLQYCLFLCFLSQKQPKKIFDAFKDPNIMFAVCACSRHQVTPKECHLHVVKRIFRYLKGHPKLGLWYPKESLFDLVAYLDNDYSGATQDRKSTTGGCQFLGRRLILWECKKQTIMATSTTEAEYVAAASACGQVLWIQNQLLDYGQQTEMATKIEAQYLEISSLKARIKLLEDKDKGSAKTTGDDATIKGRSMEIGEEAGVEKSIKRGISTVGVPTASGLFPTVSAIFTTASVVPPYLRLPRGISAKDKGKEKMVESDMPKKKKLQEQIDVQVAREIEEEMAREDQRMNEQIARDAEIAIIHTGDELQKMIDSLDRNNEVIAKHLQEYEQAANELTIRDKIELINEMVKYQDHHAKILKGMTLEEIKEKFITVWMKIKDFVPMSSKEEAKRFKRKGLRLEQESAKRIKTSEDVSEEDIKEMMQLVPVEEVYVEDLQVKHLIIDWEIHFEGEDLNLLWTLVKETLSIRQASSDKEKELWVELKRLFEPDFEEQLWTHNQNLMHDPVEWRLYDTCGVHHVFTKDQEIFMLVERDYPLRRGLATIMITNKLQVENYSQMANDLILTIHNIANSPR